MWSAATGRRFVRLRLVAASLDGLNRMDGGDKSPPNKALTSERTPH